MTEKQLADDARKWIETLTDKELITLRNRRNSAWKVAIILGASFGAGVLFSLVVL